MEGLTTTRILDRSWQVTQDVDTAILPLITLGVLSYNRIDDLRGTLDVLTNAVWYPHKEIIVIDNASADGSLLMIERLFPQVRVVSLKENVGIAARNVLFQTAKGKYVFSFDDDSFPAGPYTLLHAVEFLEQQPQLSGVCFQCYQPRTDFCETFLGERASLRVFGPGIYEGAHYVEGAMCYRTDMLREVPGFDSEFFWGGEGLDLALEFYKKEYYNVYYPELVCLHMRSPANRDVTKSSFLFTRNFIWTIFKHFPMGSVAILLPAFILRKFIVCLRHPKIAKSILIGMVHGIRGYRRNRKKTPKLTFRQALKLRPWYKAIYRW